MKDWRHALRAALGASDLRSVQAEVDAASLPPLSPGCLCEACALDGCFSFRPAVVVQNPTAGPEGELDSAVLVKFLGSEPIVRLPRCALRPPLLVTPAGPPPNARRTAQPLRKRLRLRREAPPRAVARVWLRSNRRMQPATAPSPPPESVEAALAGGSAALTRPFLEFIASEPTAARGPASVNRAHRILVCTSLASPVLAAAAAAVPAPPPRRAAAVAAAAAAQRRAGAGAARA